MKRVFLLLFCIYFFTNCNPPGKSTASAVDPFHITIQKKVIAGNGTVVSIHSIASKTGVEILKAGGNAFDAAIATQLALAVVYPSAGNLGGGGFLVARLEDGKELALDFREMAPGKAHRDMYIDETGIARTDKSQDGHLSGGVPGTVAGLFAAMAYAKLPFEMLIQPSIDLAEKGFVISAVEAGSLNALRDEFIRYNTVIPVFVKNNPWQEGDTLIQKDLANTLKRIKEKGAPGFYEGETARLIVEEMKRGNGIISYEDLKNYKAKFRTPHTFYYKGYKVVGMPMPSSGGLLLHQMLKMTESRNIAAMGFHSPQAVQLMTEAERRAYADRAEFMGDADFYTIPVNQLTSDQYLKDRMKDYDPARAGTSSAIKPGNPALYESDETTHFSVIDKEGNAVAVTTTLNNNYGSRTVIGGAGFILNDEMDDFSIKPGVPNMYGAVGGEANAIAPGKRMLSSMTPTIVLKDNRPFLVAGTKGGTTIPTSIYQTILNIIDFNLSTEDAVNKPKFHHQWLPDSLYVEHNFPKNVIAALESMGYHVLERSDIGHTHVIRILPDGRFEGIADIRGEGSAEGW
jgi:gamma-glutamyltranspeptidase / glutathione hydrolase